MNLKNEFNRIGHVFNGGAEKTEHRATQWMDIGAKRANELSERLRERVGTGTRNIVGIEEAIVRHVRENPALYLFGAALLIGALIGKLVLESRRPETSAPLL